HPDPEPGQPLETIPVTAQLSELLVARHRAAFPTPRAPPFLQRRVVHVPLRHQQLDQRPALTRRGIHPIRDRANPPRLSVAGRPLKARFATRSRTARHRRTIRTGYDNNDPTPPSSAKLTRPQAVGMPIRAPSN